MNSSIERRATPVTVRVSAALLCGALGALIVGAVEASWTSNSTGSNLFEAWLGAAGLLVPVGLSVALGVAAMSWLVHTRPPSLAGVEQWLERLSDPERAILAWRGLLFAPFAGLWLVWVARDALVVLAGEGGAPQVGAKLAFHAASLFCFVTLAVFGLAKAAAALFPSPGKRPLGALATGAMTLVALVSTWALFGETSGSGSPLAMFGVLRRPELDLRGVAILGFLVLGCYLLPGSLTRLRWPLLAVLAFAPLSLTGYAAVSGLDKSDVRQGIEQKGVFSKLSLAGMSRLADNDGDGFSALFGGGDCDDHDRAINPAADDVPENGKDEDCSGSDAKRLTLTRSQKPKKKEASKLLEEPFNVLLITIDTLRYDLGYMGYARNVSPNIDELAARSTVFERGYALASYTAKSLPPMLIGKYPSETHRDYSHFNRFGKENQFLQERLSAAGLHTVSVQGYWYFFFKGYGFERGFSVLDSSAAPKQVQMAGDRSSNSDKLSDAAISRLEEATNQSKPFFMWVHYIDPHSEYAPHEGFDFGNESRDRYDGEVAFVDHHVGRVIDALQSSSAAKKTAIVLTSDHGEAFGEHGMIRHGFELWEELVRVPLIVHVPGATPKRVAARRSIVDVAPTIVELMGAPKPSGEGTDFFSGVSLVPDIAGSEEDEAESRIVFVDMPEGPHNAERQAFIEDDLKLVVSGGRAFGLYDLANDPAEKEDLKQNSTKLTPLLERFKAFRRELKTVHVRRP